MLHDNAIILNKRLLCRKNENLKRSCQNSGAMVTSMLTYTATDNFKENSLSLQVTA